MKYHFLGTFCALLTVIGIAATTAQADVSISVPNDADSAREDSFEPAEDRAERAPKSTPALAMNSIELATYNLVNKYRQSRNLPPLVADSDISAQAKAHSERMARSGNMSHDGFHERVASVAKTIVYRNAAENVAYNMGYGQPDLVAVQGWIESPGHQKNMLGRFDLTGIGVARGAKGEYYFTQIFIRKAFYVKDVD
ncbi:CAP domain-containing protein [Chamaesiphon minutus]|uniref:Cysteine-rich secretory protein family n=1 Tax=Chamaesiphon minutus (strain ATCC 27169 / PCC 6605) TaxID=1173020 RepID=K9UMP8_CHAP6|nr:CAP domain-containing protein [Chamaesiphon minutus]AFY95933.1 Cysteine-rich secretory protein family [Chamaesiphon minutus PCC 6605]